MQLTIKAISHKVTIFLCYRTTLLLNFATGSITLFDANFNCTCVDTVRFNISFRMILDINKVTDLKFLIPNPQVNTDMYSFKKGSYLFWFIGIQFIALGKSLPLWFDGLSVKFPLLQNRLLTLYTYSIRI